MLIFLKRLRHTPINSFEITYGTKKSDQLLSTKERLTSTHFSGIKTALGSDNTNQRRETAAFQYLHSS